MKHNYFLCFYFLFFFLFILTNLSIQILSLEIKMIPDCFLNATGAFVSLDSFENTDFLYFSFDFDYHNKVNQKQAEISYFKISTELSLNETELQYTFIEKKQEEINYTDFKSNNDIYWKNIILFYKEKAENEFNYYIQINQLTNKNTLILRIPFKKSEGQIIIENLYILSEDIIELFNKIYFRNYNGWKKSEKLLINENNNRNKTFQYINKEFNINYKDSKSSSNYSRIYYNNLYKRNIFLLFFQSCSSFLAYLFLQIWIFVFILYFFINRKKSYSPLAVIIRNSEV